MNSKEDRTRLCNRCNQELPEGRGAFFEIRVEVVADPTPPFLDVELEEQEICSQYKQLIVELEQVGPLDALNQVVRRRIWSLCNRCVESWLDDPFGNG